MKIGKMVLNIKKNGFFAISIKQELIEQNDLRLLTHLRTTTNATRLLSQLRFEILELVLEDYFARTFLRRRKRTIYDCNIP